MTWPMPSALAASESMAPAGAASEPTVGPDRMSSTATIQAASGIGSSASTSAAPGSAARTGDSRVPRSASRPASGLATISPTAESANTRPTTAPLAPSEARRRGTSTLSAPKARP